MKNIKKNCVFEYLRKYIIFLCKIFFWIFLIELLLFYKIISFFLFYIILISLIGFYSFLWLFDVVCVWLVFEYVWYLSVIIKKKEKNI